jgi:hypothetical protein
MQEYETELTVRTPKLLPYDIECTGILGYSYGIWEANIHKVIEQPILLSFSYAKNYEIGKKAKIVCRTLADTDTYKVDPKNDYLLVKELYELFKDADVTIGHNSKQFDDKMANMFFLKHGLAPVVPHQQLDTKLMAKQIARFPSNSLNYLSDFFGNGSKTATTHADLWWDSINGGAEGKKAMKKMAVYNNQDVKLTIELFEKLHPWYRSPVNLVRIANLEFACPHCLQSNYHKEGTRATKTGRYQRYVCDNEECKGWFTANNAIKKNDGDIKPAVASY